MNRLLFFISVLCSLSLQATEISHDDDEEIRVTAPLFEYEDIRDQLQSWNPWTEIKVSSSRPAQTWHLHWHISSGLAKLEDQFPPHQYQYTIMRLKDLEPVRSTFNFATYQLHIQESSTGKSIDLPLYVFYLTDPKKCSLSH
jgi:hypothetical protein